MTRVPSRGPLGQKAPKPERGTAAAKAHMAAVATLPCVVCGTRPVEVHHVISGRYGQRKASDFQTIPLCWWHHRGPDGIHAAKSAWESAHGPDHSFLDVVRKMLADRNG